MLLFYLFNKFLDWLCTIDCGYTEVPIVLPAQSNTSETIYFTITGTQYFYGEGFEDRAQEFMKPGTKVKLVKEPDNKYDSAAILVQVEGLGNIGYVANSSYTILGDSQSAARIHSKFGEETTGTVYAVLPKGIICTLDL